MNENKIQHEKFLQRALALAKSGMDSNEGGPFGAIVVKDGRIIAESNNQVLLKNDPTAHAEMVAIRRACEKLDSFQLTECIIYSSCEPCPMCLGAIYWARPKAVYYAASKEDATRGEFDDGFIYEEINKFSENRSIPFVKIRIDNANEVFEEWLKKDDKKIY